MNSSRRLTEEEKTAITAILRSNYYINNRLKTFTKWKYTRGPCTAQKMAEAGFIMTGTLCAECFLCHKELDGWLKQDVPMKEHATHSPQCPFVLHMQENPDQLLVRDVLKLEMEQQLFELKQHMNDELKNIFKDPKI